MTKGGARAVTTLNTVLAREDTAATDKSPPGQMIVSSLTERPDTIPTLFHLTAVEGDVGSGNRKDNVQFHISDLGISCEMLIRGERHSNGVLFGTSM